MPSEPKCSSGPRRLDHPDVFGDGKNLGKPWESPKDGGVDGKIRGKPWEIMETYGKIHCFYGNLIGKNMEIREDPLLMKVSGEEYCNLPLAREVVQAEFLPFALNASSKRIVPKWFWGNSVAS